MLSQLYSLPMTPDNSENAQPAQFVMLCDDSPRVLGFISDVNLDKNEMTICLFDPIELPEGATSIKEQMTMDEVALKLDDAIGDNQAAYDLWFDLINDPEKQYVDH